MKPSQVTVHWDWLGRPACNPKRNFRRSRDLDAVDCGHCKNFQARLAPRLKTPRPTRPGNGGARPGSFRWRDEQ